MYAEQTPETGSLETGNRYAGEKGSHAFASAGHDGVRVPVHRLGEIQTVVHEQLRHSKGRVLQRQSTLTTAPGGCFFFNLIF